MAKGKEPVEFNVVAMSHKAAEEIATWNYPDPYTIYSLSHHIIPFLKNPSKRYFEQSGPQPVQSLSRQSVNIRHQEKKNRGEVFLLNQNDAVMSAVSFRSNASFTST